VTVARIKMSKIEPEEKQVLALCVHTFRRPNNITAESFVFYYLQASCIKNVSLTIVENSGIAEESYSIFILYFRGVHNSFFIVSPLNELVSNAGLTRVPPRFPSLELRHSAYLG
jgi:hypothetical protein